MSKHTCHWPSCTLHVSPRMWGCKRHWMLLPKRIRDAIWATYKPGQEITKTPSAAYRSASASAQVWARRHEQRHGVVEGAIR